MYFNQHCHVACSLRASSPGRSGGGAGKRRRACNFASTSLEFKFHLQFPCGSVSTELSYFRKSVRSGNECECKQTLKYTCQGNDVITNVISANQHFASTFRCRYSREALLPFPAPPPEHPGELSRRLRSLF